MLISERKFKPEPVRRPAEERNTVRNERSRPLVEAFESWLREKLSRISQKTKLAEAIRYALARWAGLCLFLDGKRCSDRTLSWPSGCG